MNLFRLIATALLIWIVWFMIRNYLASQDRTAGRKADRKTDRTGKRLKGKVVKCSACELHLPEAEALHEGDEYFCSAAHKQAWLGRS